MCLEIFLGSEKKIPETKMERRIKTVAKVLKTKTCDFLI
jgi:hypothetical protein